MQSARSPTKFVLSSRVPHGIRCHSRWVSLRDEDNESWLNLEGILTSGYFGTLADLRGRKPIAILSYLGEMLALLWILGVCECSTSHLNSGQPDTDYFYDQGYLGFPVQLVWMSSLLLFIGGGHRIFLAMIFSTISDIVHPQSRWAALILLLTELTHSEPDICI